MGGGILVYFEIDGSGAWGGDRKCGFISGGSGSINIIFPCYVHGSGGGTVCGSSGFLG